ncbi:GNAT family N-acetyltransferase [Williamsia sp. CHRR-6]|nr:GNAT family N-acetyltransferase [Williamsia sp. CHRR-6]
MNYPRGTQLHRAPLWQDHMTRPGWVAIGAVHQASAERPETLVGIAYGYRGAPDQWWNQQLCAGLRLGGYRREQIDEITRNYFELTELHVHPSMQGTGTGQRLLQRLLRDRSENSVLLSTPEVPDDDNRAWRLYRRLGFTDLLRQFTFTGDPRPFAVLGRRLPVQ